MVFLGKYIEIEEDKNNPKDSQIRTYKAKRESIIKGINIINEEEKISKKKLIIDFANENDIKIYDIIEKENSIYIVIDSDAENSLLFDKILAKKIENTFQKEVLVKGNGNYLTLLDIQKLYKQGAENVFKITEEYTVLDSYWKLMKKIFHLQKLFLRVIMYSMKII